MTALDEKRVSAWLTALPGERNARTLKSRWNDFNVLDRPVITVFGSYDTGKSSLIRRILVDAGSAVPDWLTISGRHETFDVNGVECEGCLLRDTPGLAVGAEDVRGVVNTNAAIAAVELTDIAIVVVSPQLATGERQLLRSLLLDGTWTPQDLWFVVSRFDEAGIDPEDDLEGYFELRDRKRAELRDSLDLGADFPIHVVAPDFAQFAGSSQPVDGAIWDEFRAWDGMNELEQAIAHVGGATLAHVRAATERRYWRRVMIREVSQLKSQLAEAEPLVAEAEAAESRHEQWSRELREIDLAARADLGILKEKLTTILVSNWGTETSDKSLLMSGVENVINGWFDTHQQQVDRFLQSVGRVSARQSERQSWRNFQEIASAIEEMEPAPMAPARVGKHVKAVGGAVIAALQDISRIRPAKSSQRKGARSEPSSGSVGDWSYAEVLAAATAVWKLAQVVLDEWEEYRAARETASLSEKLAQAQADKFAADAVGIARTVWDTVLDETERRLQIVDFSKPEVTDGLRQSVDQLRKAITDAEILLA
ncbi:GTPase [Rhodococcus pyridinivorans]|uniref:GTPase n=1 Tax=Rhodococcus pyridinivorans TaxID=103816 RepID=UPI00265A07FA|nr:GTPase domain-containing protein [Rhodococcus pyridinivorans]